MKQKFTTLALLYGFACSVPVYAVQYPTTANSDVRDLLCGSQEIVEALQPAKKDGWAHSVTITSATTTAIGDKAVLCNVQAVIKSKRVGVTAVDADQGERLILVGIGGDGNLVAEEIDKGLADALLSSQAVQAMATNYKGK
ncbi:hypothetical protein ACEUAI_20225 [Aeromonas veronii]